MKIDNCQFKLVEEGGCENSIERRDIEQYAYICQTAIVKFNFQRSITYDASKKTYDARL